MAMTPRENAMAIFYGRQPDYYGDIMEAITLVPDPVMFGDIPPRDGREYRDSWGTVYIWPPDAPGPHPRVTKENAVIPDIEHWQDYLKVPSLEGLDFGPAKQVAESVDRKEKFVGFMFGGGLFERSHHLMGMQDALMNYLEYPEEMAGVLREICEYKKAYIRLMAREVHPDIIFYHDDWGSKQNLFLPPRTWRALIKPLQQEISDTIHECGMIYMHHADCICQPIVTDMVEIGIDIWQGVIAQNDNQISINTSLEVDLTGQCASESIGSRQFSGTGGQSDTAVGAQMSKGGRSIIALYSTAMVKDKTTGERHEVSKIVAQLQRGAAVSLSRNDVDIVITEYGAADLRGTNIRQRVEALISIAHPKFRDELWDQALACGIIGKR